jgi:predicted AlkP superfamily phosphohydrolase/phosphomutase
MSRVMVVGWDGATWSVADELCRRGRLPALAALREGGAHGVLETVPNMNSAPAWSSIATGRNPGKHGIFYFDEPVPGTYRRTVVNASRRAGPTLWRLASEAGRRIVVVNVPISYPAEAVNGYLVAGLDTPSKALPGFTHPQDLPRRFPELFDRYIIEPGAPSLMRAGRVQEARDRLLGSVDGWASVTERLMQQEWDLVFVVFTSTDTAQHFFWTGDRRRVVEEVYEVQDHATARLVEHARSQDPDCNVIVLADHGGAANTRGPEYLPVWLQDQGLQVQAAPNLKARAMRAGFRLADRTLTRDQKQALARRLPRLRESAEAEARLGGIDWRRTQAYADGLRDEVLVNVAGRDPQGTVSQTRYRSFASDLRAAVAGIREVGTGRPVVSSIVPRDEAYSGPYVDRAPDLTIRWVLDEDRAFHGFRCETRTGTERMRELAANPPFTDGGHHPEGIFVAAGPNVLPGDVRGDLEDVTPTILALLGVPIPADLDGRPLDVLKDVQTEVAPREGGPGEATAGPSADPETGYTAEEEEAVRHRLEDMGYL